MPLLPVADVLIIERKHCVRCLTTHIAPSPFRYRLFKSCVGEPDKTEIRKLKWDPVKNEELGDLTPLAERTVYTINISMDQCQSCWAPTLQHAEALLRHPPAPVQTAFSFAYRDALSRDQGTSGRTKRPVVALADL